jgi:hypothetical protein
VIPADQLPRRPPPSPPAFDLPNPDRIAHKSKLPPINLPAKPL